MRAEICAILGGVSAGLDLEFLDGVDGGMDGCGGDEVVDDGDAIERNAVLNFASACADEVFAGRGAVSGFLTLYNAGCGDGELERVAAVERKLGHGLFADDFFDTGVVGSDGRGAGSDDNFFGDLADLEGEVGTDGDVGVDLDVVSGFGLEAGVGSGDAIGADFDELEGVVAIGIGGGVESFLGAGVDGGDGDADDGGAGSVGDVAHDRGGVD